MVLVDKLTDQRRPLRNGVAGVDEEMSFIAEWWHQVILGVAARPGIGRMHFFGEVRAEKRIVLDIDPKHRNPRGPAEFGCRFDKLVGGAVVVRLAADTSAAAACEDDERLYGSEILARERDGRPAAR